MTVHIQITDEMVDDYEARNGERVLDDLYSNYDSKLVCENLLEADVRSYLETRPDIVLGGVGTYTNDDYGVSTAMVSKPDMLRGFVIIRNLSGSYDIHEYWRCE